jgi:hypothetical protein
MRFSRCLHGIMRAGVVVAVLGAALAPNAWAKPKPRPGSGFHLFAAAQLIFQVNRVQCRIFADGQLCATGSSTVGGGIWPKGTADQYIFAGGPQIGGVVDPTGGKDVNGFAGDTAGAFFYNTAAGNGNGLALKQILAATEPGDVATWPPEAMVPCSDPATTTIPGGIPAGTIARCTAAGVGTAPEGDLFDPALQGTVSASQGDFWFVAWEGDPSNNGSRTHPLGILMEARALGWNFPSGNEDIMYMIYTFYNVTSADPNSYANVRASLRPFIQSKGRDFVALNTAKYGINLPQAGYVIKDIFVDIVNDMDVASATANYVGLNVPFALGYTYENDFSADVARAQGWTFDPAIFGAAPFFTGVGFAGVKYLLSPINPATGKQVGLSLFGTFSNSVGSLTDPNDDKQLYRYMTGHLLPTDGTCTLNPDVDKICSVNLDSPTDMRFYQSSGPFDLAPGQFGTVAVAYIFAPPVADGNCPGPSCDVKAADGGQADRLRIMGNAARMATGVNQIDRMTGYLTFDDADGNGTVTQNEITPRPGSLLGKSKVAQSVFDSRFLLPFSPEAPAFYLVPGDNNVTVLWSPSNTETTPDPFFAVASPPTVTNPDGSVSANALYDPNFRALDVEGYRVYRGRTSNPSQLTLLAQFDYAPDPATGKGIFRDFLGNVKGADGGQDPSCAPELGIQTTCAVAFSTPAPGTAYTDSVEVDLVGTVTQVKVIPAGARVKLADGTATILPGQLDTAFADITRGRVGAGVSTALTNSGVPFLFVDNTARNSVRYFYSVTAFDVNSINSGPSSLESGRATKAITPTPTASNVDNSATITAGIFGRGQALTATAVPTLDAQGRFSGPFPPADGASLAFVGQFAKQLFSQGGTVTARLVGLGLGDARDGVPGTWTFSAFGTLDTTTITLSIDPGFAQGTTSASSPAFPATQADAALAAKYGGTGAPIINAQVNFSVTNYQQSIGQDRGCGDGSFAPASGTTGCFYNGPRWFDGANETVANPNAGEATDGTGAVPGGNLNNAGGLTGVNTIFIPITFGNIDNSWRAMEASLYAAARAADFKVYWGNPGKIDSIIDVTHNVPVPFMPDSMGGGFGVLNASGSSQAGSDDGRPTVVTINDLSCVEPWRSGAAGTGATGQWPTGCSSAAPFVFSDSAELNQVAIYSGALSGGASAAPAANPGFLLYIAGRISMFELSSATLPSQTVWTLRAYTGWISGGTGAGGDLGPYKFTPSVRTFTALGADLQVNYAVTNTVVAATKSDLSQVHTVPDPYYVRSEFESSTDQKILKFVNLPQDAIIRIYSASGVLVRILEHHSGSYSPTSVSQGNETQWDLRNRNNQVVASGVYFYHIEAGDARRVGRFTVVNFAQ